MNARTQITIDPDLQRQAHAKAAELGISFAEYVRRLLADDLGRARRRVQVSAVFDLVDEGPATHIAVEKDGWSRKRCRTSTGRRRADWPGSGGQRRRAAVERLRRQLGLVRCGFYP